MSNSKQHTLQQQLNHIIAAITQIEEILRDIKRVRQHYLKKSDIGWYLSIVAEGPGVLLAVSSGKQASKLGDVMAELDQKLLLLKIDKRLKEQELKHIQDRQQPTG